ncbi:XRE family transcriptional regulator [Labrys wisconsinensis]|uniref:DNA-binding XRE family transcriptional regulator n=1 Tax=Labrys wisconsinensis TaxID=425677 RepID=A0ABU0J5R4_9HYPH|nr:XRE family transcriptional regulator [Labrys wisconsinensis]MDQ0469596.1 DNA-binding XRE family transcriptional regulator [Labrys wisconsinensis]
MAIPADEVLRKTMTPAERAESERRAERMAARYLTLQQLRKARDLTQVQLARILHKDQVSISQLEKRSDMLLSTLRSYVEAMGGRLDLVVQFEGREPVVLSGLGDEEAGSPASAQDQPAPASVL